MNRTNPQVSTNGPFCRTFLSSCASPQASPALWISSKTRRLQRTPLSTKNQIPRPILFPLPHSITSIHCDQFFVATFGWRPHSLLGGSATFLAPKPRRTRIFLFSAINVSKIRRGAYGKGRRRTHLAYATSKCTLLGRGISAFPATQIHVMQQHLVAGGRRCKVSDQSMN